MKRLATLFLVLIFISHAFFASDEIMNSNEAVNEGFICGTPLIPSIPVRDSDKDNTTITEDTTQKDVSEQNENLKTSLVQSNDFHFYVGGYFAPTLRIARGDTFAVGGHVGVDFHPVKEFSIGPYIHGEYFFAPLGSNTGYYGGLEIELEGGVNFTYNIYRSKSFALKLGCDFGYYMQWLQYNSNISTKAHLSYNGMMLRPTFTIQFAEFSGMPLGIAIYYQKTAIIPYSDYDGLGVMLIL